MNITRNTYFFKTRTQNVVGKLLPDPPLLYKSKLSILNSDMVYSLFLLYDQV